MHGLTPSPNNYYFTRDHLGSVREMTDAAGALHALYDYSPYGHMTKVSGDLDSDFTYAGYYNHATSRLNFTLFRAYNSYLGRWVSRDPIAELGGINLYGYVGNSPINRRDPNGLAGLTVIEGPDIGTGLSRVSGLTTAAEDAAAVDALGGGPENPVADLAAYGVLVSSATSSLVTRSGLADWIAGKIVGTPDSAPLPMPAASGGRRPPRKPPCSAPPGFPGDEQHSHHWLPNEFRDFFENAGINIDDPEYMEEIPQQWHTGQEIGLHPRGYNPAFGDWIDQNPNASSDEIIQQMYLLKAFFGY